MDQGLDNLNLNRTFSVESNVFDGHAMNIKRELGDNLADESYILKKCDRGNGGDPSRGLHLEVSLLENTF